LRGFSRIGGVEVVENPEGRSGSISRGLGGSGGRLVAQGWRFSGLLRLRGAPSALIAIRQERRFEVWRPEFSHCQVVETARSAVADRWRFGSTLVAVGCHSLGAAGSRLVALVTPDACLTDVARSPPLVKAGQRR
jgi:hypothetical protein